MKWGLEKPPNCIFIFPLDMGVSPKWIVYNGKSNEND
jgi:hypothetical protein